jgi:hypothetical protein
MVEAAEKPLSNRSAKERRNTFFWVLDGFLSTTHKKFMLAATTTAQQKIGRTKLYSERKALILAHPISHCIATYRRLRIIRHTISFISKLLT